MYKTPSEDQWHDEPGPGRKKYITAIYHRYVRKLGYGARRTDAERERLEQDPLGKAAVEEFNAQQASGKYSGKSWMQSNEEAARFEAFIIKYHSGTVAADTFRRMRNLEPGLQLPDIPAETFLAYIMVLHAKEGEMLNGIPGRGLAYPTLKKAHASLFS